MRKSRHVDRFIVAAWHIKGTQSNTQWTHGVIITSLLRPTDVVTSFWRYDDVGIALCVPWIASNAPADDKTAWWHFCFSINHINCITNSFCVRIFSDVYMVSSVIIMYVLPSSALWKQGPNEHHLNTLYNIAKHFKNIENILYHYVSQICSISLKSANLFLKVCLQTYSFDAISRVRVFILSYEMTASVYHS